MADFNSCAGSNADHFWVKDGSCVTKWFWIWPTKRTAVKGRIKACGSAWSQIAQEELSFYCCKCQLTKTEVIEGQNKENWLRRGFATTTFRSRRCKSLVLPQLTITEFCQKFRSE